MAGGARAVEGLEVALTVLGQLGLGEKEARVLAALVSKGSATAAQLAHEADLYRTNVYPVLESLEARGLIGRLPGRTSVWSTSGLDPVVDRLYAESERRHTLLQARKDELRAALAAAEEVDAAAVPRVDLVMGATECARVYEDMLRSARDEVLVFNRPPYGASLDGPNDAVLDLLARGVQTRVLYRANELELEGFRGEAQVYLTAGVQARVTDELPTKLVVADRRTVLVAIMEPGDSDDFPVSQYADHPGFAAPWAAVFDCYWATSMTLAERFGPAPAQVEST